MFQETILKRLEPLNSRHSLSPWVERVENLCTAVRDTRYAAERARSDDEIGETWRAMVHDSHIKISAAEKSEKGWQVIREDKSGV